MQVNIISDTIQEFDGVRYYRCGPYFQRKGVRLHRTVWERVNGRKVPDGFEVHHADEDRANNQPGNLELLDSPRHRKLHSDGRGIPVRIQEMGREAAKDWHASPEGRTWHKSNYENNARTALAVRVMHSCGCCGKPFEGPKHAKFCSQSCGRKHRRATGVDQVVKVCEHCGDDFSSCRQDYIRFCCRSCATKHWRAARGTDRVRDGDGCVVPVSS